MSLNDLSINPSQANVYNGVANPTSSSLTSDPKRDNFVTDPTSDEAGAGAGPGFQGGQDAKRALKNAAGVVEAHPGILEEVNIPPLSNEEPGFDAPSTQKTSTATSTLSGGAKIAFGTVTGNQDTLEQGRQEYYGEKH
ncbi:Sgt1 [Rhizoctonia solani AG-3 Rhs1AP]|uniref:Sgt1 n=1 Tax=Rhizoctonia solani AG-3 Rhs1AP TaxID=1086054 RepID=X8JUE7_9AGAM|nr:Sgt1 [Rhizoctonia solani AG-3 Rhs1AP]